MSRCLLLLLLAAACPAAAQVIEIGDDGRSAVYDRPTLFTADGPTPVTPTPRMRAAATSDPLAAAAREHGIAPGLLEAVAWTESRGRMDAVSPRGALGVMQLMPATATEMGVDPRDRDDNIRGGALYLRRQLQRFGSVPLALAAYNAGPGAVARFGGVPPFRETRAYVAGIMARWRPGVVTQLAARAPRAGPILLIEVPAL